MPESTTQLIPTIGECDLNETEPKLERHSERPTTLPEIDMSGLSGSTTGIMRIRREGIDPSAQGDEDRPI